MKKTVLIVSSLCIGIMGANAQITLTSADMPTPTQIIYQANDTMPTVSVGSASATTQNWDFTALAQHTVDTSTVLPYSAMPNSAFSTANIIVKQGSSGLYGYGISSSSSMLILGGGGSLNILGSPTPINQINTPAEIAFKFPASYDSAFISDYVSDARFHFGHTVQGITVDSIHRKSEVHKTSHIDAFGTMTTPSGGPYNVLRYKETTVSHDTAKAFFFGGWQDIPGGISESTTVTYTWWANGMGAALAKATMDSTSSTVVSVQWLGPQLHALATSTQVSCHGVCDGTATATAQFGTAPYTYSWDTNPVQTTATATGLCVGPHTVTVVDSVGDTTYSVVTVHLPPNPTITATGAVLHTNFTATSFQWFLNGTAITAATTSSYTVTQNGNYTIVATTGTCHDTSALYNFHTIGISELNTTNSVSIYPNPATSQITIQLDALTATAKQDLVIEFRNELGQSVKKVGIVGNSNQLIINVADLPNGVYFIQMQNASNTINKKFIKQ